MDILFLILTILMGHFYNQLQLFVFCDKLKFTLIHIKNIFGVCLKSLIFFF